MLSLLFFSTITHRVLYHQEALAINSSLSALGDVVAALASKSKHVPYR